ncbi:hypothetical protein BCD49_05010 [Pseudofrankia sp. EUN1h]|nr:hypothetical protein BCD49_05010 [Pseudofrankia sp. EUN1h]
MTATIHGPSRVGRTVGALPPASFFGVSAVFHYLGPSLAVLLFARVDALGVAWLRIASAAVVFAVWRRPWRALRRLRGRDRWVLVGLGGVLAGMNSLFYLAVDRLPLSTVGAVEFLGVVALAAAGARTRRNVLALALAIAGVLVLTDVRLAGQPLGFVFAFANCAGFMLYVMLGHRVATASAAAADDHAPEPMGGIDQLGAAMLVAAFAATPAGIAAAAPAFTHPVWLVWGIGVGVCSSVIPYVADQLAMARLPRATFALMLALLPAAAAVIGLAVLGQVPTWRDLAGIALVITGVAAHQPAGRPVAASHEPSRRVPRDHRHGRGRAGQGENGAVSADEPAEVRLERVGAEVTLPLRQRVLRPHQTVRDVAFPGDDEPDSAHVVAVLADGTVVGTVSVLREAAPWGAAGWRLRGMATDEAMRGRGIGARLFAAVVGHVRDQGGGLLWCNARVRAVPFYEREGLRTRGEVREEPGIGPHVVMWRDV